MSYKKEIIRHTSSIRREIKMEIAAWKNFYKLVYTCEF